MRLKFPLLTFSFLLAFTASWTLAFSQCPDAAFSINGASCSNTPLDISNTTMGAHSFLWDFCTEDFENPQLDTSQYPTNGLFGVIAGARFAEDPTGTHCFICNRSGSLVRADFGNGINQPITGLVDLGSLSGAAGNPNDISLIQENGVWFAFVVNVFDNTVGKLEFANGLDQPPTTAQVVITGLSLPRGVKVVKDSSGTFHLFAANFTSNTITHHSFGSSLSNPPTLLSTFSVPNSANVIDLDLIQDCDNWYMAVCSYSSQDLVIADLGSDLNNISPIYSNSFTNESNCYSVNLIRNGRYFYSLTTSASGRLIVQRLGSGLASISPVINGTYLFGSASTDLALILKESVWYGLTPFESGSGLVSSTFHETCLVNPASSSDSIPTGVIYSLPDSFEVTLTTTAPSGRISTRTESVIIAESPNARFVWSGNCDGIPTQFTSTSSISSASINAYSWDFGDASNSNDSTPAHQYLLTGDYNVTLDIIASNGCEAAFDTTVRISPVPIPAFSIGNSCSETPLPLNNSSTVASGAIVAWNWDFGNGDSSSDSLPVYAYPGGGTFPVTLTVTSDAGCTSSDTSGVFIQDRPVGAFAVSNTCTGQTVQLNDLSTIQNASITATTWYFGDGDSSSVQNPAHTYPGGAANYPLQLVVTASNGCIDTVDVDLRISEQPNSSFSFSPAAICNGMPVAFNDLSSVVGDTIAAWQWDFGDGRTDTIQNPTHTYSLPGTYSVTLVAYSPTSCAGLLFSQNISVLQAPSPGFIAYDACIGDAMNFTDQSVPVPGDNITGYDWDFGNGDSSNLQNPSINYQLPGAYQVIQTITTLNGCVTSDTQSVFVRELPVASFSTSLPCNGQTVDFTNTSTTDPASSLLYTTWNFGDPASGTSNSSIAFSASHLFSGLSTFNVSLIVQTNFGCKDTAVTQVVVLPSSPAQFTYSPTCYGDLMEFFNPGSVLDSAYLWDFGDNQFNQLQEPAHFYAFPGTYSVTLYVTAATGCVTKATRSVTVSPIPVASFSASASCFGTPYLFDNNSSIGSGSIVGYQWRIANSIISTSPSPSYLFPDTGEFLVQLIVTSDIGCQDTYTGTITNHPLPIASFTFNPQFGNPPLAVNFTDLSVGGATYSWDFGDGTASGSGPDPIHIYQDTGFFLIKELVTSPFGCKDSLTKNIYVIKPVLDIAVLDDSSYRIGDNFYVVSLIANLGTRPIDSVQMEVRLDQGSTIREKYIQTIPNGPEGLQRYSFKAAFYLPDAAAPRFYCIRADSPNGEQDDVPENNERCFNRTPELQINVFPNPFTDQLTIDLILPTRETLKAGLYDLQGRLLAALHEGDAEAGLLRLEDSYPGLAAGTYALKVEYRNKTEVSLIVKR